MELKEIDFVRIDEIKAVLKSLAIKNTYGITKKDTTIKSFAEVGFKNPKLLKYYKDDGIKDIIGYDVIDINIEVAKSMGFDAHYADLNYMPECNLSLLSNMDLVVCYHVLEHVSRPDIALLNIFRSMKKGSFFHVEVPIEMGTIPNLSAGHMFGFFAQDLYKFLLSVGFKVLGISNYTPVDDGRFLIERCFCVKI